MHRLVTLLEGTVEVHSEGHGRGSEFVVRLPLAQGSPDRAESDQHSGGLKTSPARPSRILLADDCEDFTELYALMLKTCGYEVRVAHDGAMAVEAALEFQPQAVLMDIGLPTLDGYEGAARLRSRPETSQLLLVALSGRAEEEDRSRSHEAGFDHYLTKPVRSTAVEELLAAPCRSRHLT